MEISIITWLLFTLFCFLQILDAYVSFKFFKKGINVFNCILDFFIKHFSIIPALFLIKTIFIFVVYLFLNYIFNNNLLALNYNSINKFLVLINFGYIVIIANGFIVLKKFEK